VRWVWITCHAPNCFYHTSDAQPTLNPYRFNCLKNDSIFVWLNHSGSTSVSSRFRSRMTKPLPCGCHLMMSLTLPWKRGREQRSLRLGEGMMYLRYHLPHTFVRINVAKHIVETRWKHEVALLVALVSTPLQT
jgi:hypothetical protein